jgi:hypothetical protein
LAGEDQKVYSNLTMKDNIDILKAWLGAGVTLAIQHFGLVQEGLSVALIFITSVYTGFKALNEYHKYKERKKGGSK